MPSLDGLGLLTSGMEADGFEAIPEARLAGRSLCELLAAAVGVLSEVPLMTERRLLNKFADDILGFENPMSSAAPLEPGRDRCAADPPEV